MIKLTKKNGTEVLINMKSVKSIETTDVTTLIFFSGDRMKVEESESQILQLIKAFEKRDEIKVDKK
ncbi:MAG: flagellar FlbD family protein [Acidobacteriota bacterium]